MSELSNGQVIGLVAGREITTRLRSKAYRIATLIMVVVVVGLAVIMKLVSGAGSADTVGYTASTAALAAPLRSAAHSIDQQVNTKLVSDQQTGEQQVRSGKLDALLIGDGQEVTVVVKRDIDGKLSSALNVLAGQLAFAKQIIDLHGDPAKVYRAESSAKATVQPLEPPHNYQSQQLVLGIIAGILIYISLMTNGQTVAQGVVEEKSSRVVELLLATIRPWQLMAGKVLGIGLVGLIQMVAIGAAGVIAGLTTGALNISITAAVSTVVWLVVWYLLGFLMYAIVFAALGALVSRQEDVGGAVMPALMLVVAGYVIGVTTLPSDPSSTLVEVLSVIPFFAPTLMPMRLAMGGVPTWETITSVVLVIAMIPGLIWLAGRIYRNAVLRTGARVKLSHALRAS